MFNSNKSCVIWGFVVTLVYLVAMFFLVRLAKDDAVFIVACFVAVGVEGWIGGKCMRNLLADGGFLTKIAGILIAAIFAVGTLVVIYFALVM